MRALDQIAFLCVLGVSAVSLLQGCASNGSRAASATGGTDFVMYVRDATGAETLFEVDRDGRLGFGGGLSARIGKITWTGQLTPEELAQFRELLAVRNWFDEKPASTGEPSKQRYRVEINSPEVRRRFTVKGKNAALEPMRELLAHASLRRLEADLKALPQPGPQKR